MWLGQVAVDVLVALLSLQIRCPPVSPDTPSLSGWLYCTYMWLGQVALDVLVALLYLQILLLYQDGCTVPICG